MAQSVFVVATLWEYILPLDRGDRYEDPLEEALSAENLGEVTGGGSQLSNDCGIEFVDIEIELNDLENGLAITKSALESQGAPKGSELRYTQDDQDVRIEFGVTECVAVFLDGVGLADEVYENSDINELAKKIDAALSRDSLGEIRGSWAGPTETAIFIYGLDAEEIYRAIETVLNSYALCQNARVVVRHGNPILNPRTTRIPKHE